MSGPKKNVGGGLGTSHNERLEAHTQATRYPKSDPTNPGQKAVDWTEGAESSVELVRDTKSGTLTVYETRSGGKWIQNKLLDPIKPVNGLADLAGRVRANVITSMEKLDSQLRLPKVITRPSSNGDNYSLHLRDPHSFEVHLEVPGFEELGVAQRSALQQVADDAKAFDMNGLSVSVIIEEPSSKGVIPPQIRVATDELPDGLEFLPEAAAKYDRYLLGSRGPQRGFATVGGLVFMLFTVGSVAAYVISKSPRGHKLEALGQCVTEAIPGIIFSRLVPGVGGFFASLVTGLKSDRSGEENYRDEAVQAFIRERFPHVEVETDSYGDIYNQVYNLLFKTQPIELFEPQSPPVDRELDGAAIPVNLESRAEKELARGEMTPVAKSRYPLPPPIREGYPLPPPMLRRSYPLPPPIRAGYPLPPPMLTASAGAAAALLLQTQQTMQQTLINQQLSTTPTAPSFPPMNIPPTVVGTTLPPAFAAPVPPVFVSPPMNVPPVVFPGPPWLPQPFVAPANLSQPTLPVPPPWSTGPIVINVPAPPNAPVPQSPCISYTNQTGYVLPMPCN